jgi:serine/threonine protein kinase
MLTYEPQKRITAAGALTHPFFDELRSPTARLPDGEPLPPLFNFTDEELALFKDSPDVLDVLIPPHARTPANWKRGPSAAGAAGSSSSAGASKPDVVARTGSGSGAAARDTSSRASDLTLSSPTAAAVGSAAAGAAGSKPAGAAGGVGKLHVTAATASESVASPRQSAASGANTGR